MIALAASTKRGGYTVLEMAISLAVMGLLLGSALYPINARKREQDYATVREDLADIRQAVIDYAASSSASGFNWQYSVGTAVENTGYLAPGRKYLPCPDVDGDGREDRVTASYVKANVTRSSFEPFLSSAFRSFFTEFDQVETGDIDQVSGVVTVVSPTPTVTLALSHVAVNAGDPDLLVRFISDTAQPALIGYGDAGYGYCSTDYGLVPWTTLGTAQADPWGNRYLYRVDPSFAHSLLGFGPESRADVMDPMLPLQRSFVATTIRFFSLEATMSSPRSAASDVYRKRQTTKSIVLSGRLHIDPQPGMICTTPITWKNNTPQDAWGRCNWLLLKQNDNRIGDNYIGYVADSASNDFTILAGVTVVRPYAADEPIDGAAFVVVSSGANRRASISSGSRVDGSGALPQVYGTLVCNTEGNIRSYNEVIEGSNFPAELCISNNPRVFRFPTNADSHAFMQLTRGRYSGLTAGYPDDFDDELVYVSGGQLLRILANSGVDLGPVWIPPRRSQ